MVYLLDGRDNFIQLVAILKRYSEMHTQILPEMIVVGIENLDFNSRMMDFSPTTGGDPEKYGGGNKFLEFIQSELFPYIEKKYSGSDNRTIVGHSFGGLAVMNALTTRPEMFDNFLLIDSSLYFDNELFLNDPKFILKGKDLKNKNLYIAIANTATYGSDLESIKTDTLRANKYVRHSLNLVDQINSLNSNLNMVWKYYENETHGSTAFIAQLDGFRFFYSWFEFKEEHNYRNKYFQPKRNKNRFAKFTKVHFENVSEKLGYRFIPEENWLSSYASSLYSFQNQPDQAKETFNLNIEYNPKSPNVYKDIAEFYLTQSDTVSARKYYKKSLELNDNLKIKVIVEILENSKK